MKAIKVAVLLVTAVGAGYGLGYLEGSGASHALAIIGRLCLAVFLLLVLSVLAKIIVAVLIRRKGGPSPGGGGRGDGGSRPPRAPVPRPPGGRPPALSAAAEIKPGAAA